MKPILDHRWRLYGNSNTLLLQTGIGKLKAAAAVSALMHIRPDIRAIINAGIAGGNADIGDIFLAHQVHDQGSRVNWYPHLPPHNYVNTIPTSVIETVDRPSAQYQPNTLLDMEAAGVMSAASHYLTTDAIQFVKVVSDNSESSITSITSSTATSLMQATVPIVLGLKRWLTDPTAALHSAASTRALHDTITSIIHHSATEKHQLLRLLQQHVALTGSLPDTAQLLNSANSEQLIKTLRATQAIIPLVYGGGG